MIREIYRLEILRGERLKGRWGAADIVSQNRPMPQILLEIEQQKVSMDDKSGVVGRAK